MPAPSTTGGLMGYPTTVDTGQVTPLALFEPAVLSTSSAAAVAAGQAYATGITVYAPVTVTKMRCNLTGSPTGNVDMGIYDASAANNYPGNLLGHTGPIAAVAGLFTQSLTANLLLSPGQYWLAFLDTVADSVYMRSFQGTPWPCVVRGATTGLAQLAASFGTANDYSAGVLTIALLLNSFS